MKKNVRSFPRARASQNKDQLCWNWWFNVMRWKLFSQFLVDFVSGLGGVYLDAIASVLELLYNGDGLFFKGLKSFFDSFRIVIQAPRLFCTLHDSLHQDFRRAIKINEIPHHNVLRDLFFELLPILKISRETIEQISSVAVGWYAFFKQFDN